MTQDYNGSKPGPDFESQRPQLYKLPTVDYHIPRFPNPEDSASVTECPAHPALGDTSPPYSWENEKKDAPVLEAQSTIGQDEVTYPEGGLAGWLVCFGSFSAMLACFGLMNTIGTFQAYLSENQLKELDESTIGWIFSVYVFLSFFCGIQIGPIFDAKGPKALIASGGIMLCASMLLLGLCTQYYQFMLCFGVLGGIGTSLLFTPAVSAIGHFFLLKRGSATGIAAAGGSVGGVIFPLMLQRLFPRVGFAWSTRIMGFIFILLCTTAQLLIRSRLPPKPGQSVSMDLRIFRDRSFAFATAGVFFMEWGLFVPITYLTTFALASGAFDPTFAYQLIAIFNAGSSLGRAVPGYLADKLGRFNSMVAMLAFCAATTLTLWLPAAILEPATPAARATIKALAVAYALLFGFASGSNISLTPVCVGQLCDTSEYGRYYATCYTVVSFGTLTGIPIAGAILQATAGRYWGVVVWTGLCYTASLGMFVWARGGKVGWKLGVKY
ncbi:MFS general substrate transporter [Mytilinidion resinicola]|uniref:MFS general substrate transporter n=1 Tax=Mytilinidion resinicola TaxID=574789 RepID=A0A6A6YWG6_9PEZI|nr:MFS general substrate transporter [Mytilinidion resinicola]KAF2812859.1 MFS general substrate transporter [Mytilinidion resinicola]